jgi:hypothetical protein
MATYDGGGSLQSNKSMPANGFTDKDGNVIKKKQYLQAQRKERKERQALKKQEDENKANKPE